MSAYPIPDAALDDRIGFVGTAGSGKTYNSGSAVERVLSKNGRCIIPDALGVWWGLRLLADGKTPSPFNVVIFGGPHGDLPLNEHAGALVGETVAGMSESAILDLSEFGPKAAERRFMHDFLAALYRHASGEPVHIIFDEADLWAPQTIRDKEGGKAATLYAHMETIVRRGRVKGFIPWLISQRPAVLAKDVLSQVDGLIAFKLTSDQDRGALEGWIEGQADKGQWRDIRASLPTMQRGQGVVWLPGHGVLRTESFPKKTTFDSSRTPKRGENKHRAVALKPIEIATLKDRLAKVEAETKANDPKALKAEIAKLQRQMREAAAAASKAGTAPDPKAIEEAEARGHAAGRIEGHVEGFVAASQELGHRAASAIATLQEALVLDETTLAKWRARIPAGSPAPRHERRVGPAAALAKPRAATPSPVASGDGTLTRPQQRVINSLIFWKSIGHEAPSREQVGAVAGYSPSSGGFNNLIGGLRTAGQLDIPMPGHVALANGSAGASMTADEAREMMFSVLSHPQRRIIAAMEGTEALPRETVGELTDYSPTSGGFNNLIGSLCTLGILTKPAQGHVALSDWAAELLT